MQSTVKGLAKEGSVTQRPKKTQFLNLLKFSTNRTHANNKAEKVHAQTINYNRISHFKNGYTLVVLTLRK